jgi:hypothetical protein
MTAAKSDKRPLGDLERIACLLDLWTTDLGRPEIEFLQNAKKGLAKYGVLTPKMKAWLDRIWQRTAGKPDDGEEPGRWA